jgi:hypothetical protein
MLVFCNGMARSASTWSFNVVVRLLRRASPGAIHAGYDENLHRFSQMTPAAAAHAAVKCHSLDRTGLMLIQVGAAKVVFTWRDPVDAVASFMIMFNTDFEKAFKVISDAIDLYHFHRRHGGLTLGYEDIVTRPADCIAQIADYLDLPLDDACAADIAEANSMKRMRQKVEEISSLDYGPRLIRRDRGLYDPETLLNVDHIRHGGSGYGKDLLNPSQLNRIAAALEQKGPLT